MAIRVGLCGFTIAADVYPRRYPLVEVQQTFYDPPSDALMRRWRERAPPGFEFTIKAWQLVTHGPASPTWRRLKRDLPADLLAGAGGFRDTPAVAEGWRATLHAAALLDATGILLQCPASFRPTAQGLDALRGFLGRVDRPEGVRILFEPRGPAWGKPDAVAALRALCADHDVVHVVDPFVHETVTRGYVYWRLHGLGGFRHVYTDEELARLAALIRPEETTCVMFNNIPRAGDAERFKRIAGLPAEITLPGGP